MLEFRTVLQSSVKPSHFTENEVYNSTAGGGGGDLDWCGDSKDVPGRN